MLKRKIEEELIAWKNDSNHKPLVIKGCRQCGKTFIVQKFAEENYANVVYLNFMQDSDYALAFEGSKRVDDIVMNLSAMIPQSQFVANETCIIIDEIQECPAARTALKFFKMDGRYDIIATGSLLGVKGYGERRNSSGNKSSKTSIPVGYETIIDMYPLDFEEFLWANDDFFTMDIIREHYEKVVPFGTRLNRDILRKFREYMCVGGMPQAVVVYVKTKDFERVDFAKREILNLYRNDIKEQDEENSEYVGNILDDIPSELARHDSPSKTNEFHFSHLDKNARLREYQGPLRWLDEAMIVNLARNTTEPSPALTLNLDDRRLKCYLMDTGLLINLSFGDGNYIDNDLYNAILTDRLHVNEGMFVENDIAQCLRINGHKIVFYVEYDKNGNMLLDIDFLIRKDKKVIPIEAKSGEKYTIKSLEKLKKKFSNKIGLQYVLHEGDIKRENEILYLPYYIASIL